MRARPTPTYSSRWKAVIRSQGIAGVRAQRGQELVLRRRGGEDRRRAARRASTSSRRCAATCRGRGAAHRRRDRGGPRPPAGRGRARARPSAGAPGGRRAQRRRRPADEVRQRHLRLLDRRVPALLPLERDPAVVAARACSTDEHPLGRELAAAGQRAAPRRPARRRRPAAHDVLHVDVADARRRGRRALPPASLRASNAFAGSHTTPTAARAARGPGRAACRARARSRRATRARPRPRAAAPPRPAAASASAIQRARSTSRSCPACTRSPNTRMPGAPSARRQLQRPRGLVERARRAPAPGGSWKNDRVSTQETASAGVAQAAPASRAGRRRVSSGRAHSASSPSRKRSSTPS